MNDILVNNFIKEQQNLDNEEIGYLTNPKGNVIKELNKIFKNNWMYEVENITFDNEHISCRCTLYIPESIRTAAITIKRKIKKDGIEKTVTQMQAINLCLKECLKLAYIIEQESQFTNDQIESLKQIKKDFEIDKMKTLMHYVTTWNKNIKKYEQLNKDNIDDFINWIYKYGDKADGDEKDDDE